MMEGEFVCSVFTTANTRILLTLFKNGSELTVQPNINLQRIQLAQLLV